VREKKGEFLVGKDGTKYFKASDWFQGECGVTYEYIRRLDARFSSFSALAETSKPKPKKQPRLSAGTASGKASGTETDITAKEEKKSFVSMTLAEHVQDAFESAVSHTKFLDRPKTELFYEDLIKLLEKARQPVLDVVAVAVVSEQAVLS